MALRALVFADSDFLRALSAALHHTKLKMSACVGTYPTASGGVDVFYDTAVVAATSDVVRVMNYDMYCKDLDPPSLQPDPHNWNPFPSDISSVC